MHRKKMYDIKSDIIGGMYNDEERKTTDFGFCARSIS